MRKILLATGIILVVLIGLVLIGSDETRIGGNRQEVTTSFYPLYYLANEIGGGLVKVNNLTPPGAEPHDYELTPQDVISIRESRLLIISGNLEPWESKIEELVGENGPEVIRISEEGNDPHVWLSPRRTMKIAARISDELVMLNGENRQRYEQNTTVLMDRLSQLDAEYKSGLNRCQRKEIVTSHASFGYLAEDYGLVQISISGLSPDEEPSIRRLGEIARLVKEKGVTTVFFESLVSPKLAQTIARETGAQTAVLNPIEGLTPNEAEVRVDYMQLMRTNLVNLKEALGCQ